MRRPTERACADCGDVRYRLDLRRTEGGVLLCPDCHDRFTVLAGRGSA